MKKHISYKWMSMAAFICAVYVILGAFGAHGLEHKLSADELQTYQTGLRYMIIHGLAIILLSYMAMSEDRQYRTVKWLFLGGIVFFSFGLLLHATRHLWGFEMNIFALVAPLGGLSFVCGWLFLSIQWLKR